MKAYVWYNKTAAPYGGSFAIVVAESVDGAYKILATDCKDREFGIGRTNLETQDISRMRNSYGVPDEEWDLPFAAIYAYSE